MKWYNPHSLYAAMKTANTSFRHLTSTVHVRLLMQRDPTPSDYEEPLQAGMLAVYAIAKRAGISDADFVAGAQAVVDFAKQRQGVGWAVTVLPSSDTAASSPT